MRSAFAAILALTTSGCGLMGTTFSAETSIASAPADSPVPTPTPSIVMSPLASFTLTSDQTTIHGMSLEPTSRTPPDYGYDEMNGGLRGRFRFDSTAKSFLYERSLASGGAWNDFTLWPTDGDGLLAYKMNQVSKISVKIKGVVNTNGGMTQCGLSFGFGDAAGHANAANSGASLRLGNRDWASATNAHKVARDYFRFSYGFSPAAEKLVVDAPINSYNQAAEWSSFSVAEWRESAGEIDVIPGTMTLAAGDEITYVQEMSFDNAANSVVVKISGFESNLSTTGWATSVEKTWDYSASPSNVDGTSGSLRGGLDLANVNGATMTSTELQDQKFHLGFVGNQQARLCEFSDLRVTLR